MTQDQVKKLEELHQKENRLINELRLEGYSTAKRLELAIVQKSMLDLITY